MKNPDYNILFVDDEPQALMCYESIVLSEGGNPFLCNNPDDIMKLLYDNKIDIVVLDLKFPGKNGIDILHDILNAYPEIPVIIVTGVDDLDSTVKCMRAGAYDYITKPVEISRLLASINRVHKYVKLRKERESLLRSFSGEGPVNPDYFSDIITASSKIKPLFSYIEGIANTGEAVLITGETGVGKDIFAKSIHRASGRKGKFIAINTAGIDDHVFSDTLFGHKKGAFTGADEERAGLIEAAADGTLFLDEIGDLQPSSQAKLLRLLQDGDYLKLGEDFPRKSNARILTATNRTLDKMQENNEFRKDLYYRIKTHRLHVPPLRERTEDLPLLVDTFIKDAAIQLEKKRPTVPPQIFDLLSIYSFPGNIRELKSIIFDAVSQHQGHVMSLDVIKKHIMPAHEESPAASSHRDTSDITFGDKLPNLKEIQGILVAEAMKRTNNNKSLAAKLIGATRQAINHHIK